MSNESYLDSRVASRMMANDCSHVRCKLEADSDSPYCFVQSYCNLLNDWVICHCGCENDQLNDETTRKFVFLIKLYYGYKRVE